MSTEHFRRVESMFHRLVDLSLEDRQAQLAELLSEDGEAHDEVCRLLAIDDHRASQATSLLVEQLQPLSGVGESKTGDRIGPFVLRRLLGEGGMGAVWEALQESPVRRTVALKLIKSGMSTAGVVARFATERQSLALMDHPAIARVFEAGATADGRPYFAMEYVPGAPVQRFCDQRKLSISDRLELFAEVCDAVHHAHQKGVLHRDLKPSNILVRMQEERPAPKVIDFGIAKAITERASAEEVANTELGQLVGTPTYMSPEAAGGLDLDVRSDVYSLGVVLHELMVGDLPIPLAELRELDRDEIRRRIREEEIPRPSQRVVKGAASEEAARRATDPAGLERRLRGDVDWIVLKALAKERERRYGSAADLAEDVRRHLRHEPVMAGPPSASYRARKFVRRHRLGVAGTTVALLALVSGTVLASLGLVRARRAERIALDAKANAESEAEAAAQIADFLTGLFRGSDPHRPGGETLTARQLLDRGAERIGAELAEQPLLRARLLNNLGVIYGRLGLYEEAEKQLVETIELRRQQLGVDSPDLTDSRVALATILSAQLKLDEAAAQLREALRVREIAFGSESEPVAEVLNNLARVHRLDLDFTQARPLLERALVITERELGSDHPDAAIVLANLGAVDLASGELESARRRFEAALTVTESALGPTHPLVAALLNNLGMAHRRLGQHRQALAAYARALEFSRETLGNRHPDIAGGLRNLSYVERILGHYQDAARHLEESRAIYAEALGAEGPRIAETEAFLGHLAVRAGEYERASSHYSASLRLFSRHEGARERRWRIHTLEDQARSARLLGRPDETVSLCRRALEETEELDTRPATLGGRCQLQLALQAVAEGDLDEAQRRYAEAEKAVEREDGTDLLDDPAEAASRAAYWAARGDADRAFELLFRALEAGRVEAWAPQNPDLAPLAGDPRFAAFRAGTAERLARP